MKKLLSIAAVAALLSTGAVATENEISVQGTVEAGAQVSMGAAPTGTLTGGTFIFEGGAIGFEAMPLNQDSVDTQDIYVNTNSVTGITMAIADGTNGGNMVDGAGHTVNTSYTLMGNAVTVGGAAIELTSGTNDGTSKVGDIVTKAHPAADQVSGDYSTTLTVTIAQQ